MYSQCDAETTTSLDGNNQTSQKFLRGAGAVFGGGTPGLLRKESPTRRRHKTEIAPIRLISPNGDEVL